LAFTLLASACGDSSGKGGQAGAGGTVTDGGTSGASETGGTGAGVTGSPTGTRAVFGSDWGGGASVDTYVVELPSYRP
jgi:hypothetical protein